VKCYHAVPERFTPGQPLPLSLTADGVSVRLFYRHVNHAERWRSVPMTYTGGNFTAAIPSDYTDSVFPLQYYFELSHPDAAWFYPALETGNFMRRGIRALYPSKIGFPLHCAQQ
jgi:hypothetical protein